VSLVRDRGVNDAPIAQLPREANHRGDSHAREDWFYVISQPAKQ